MIEAKEAGGALQSIGDALLEKDVIDGQGYNEICRVAGVLKGRSAASDWDFEISTGQPITFSEVQDRSGIAIRPQIVARIAVSQGHQTKPPFSRLDIALEIKDNQSQTLSRWHIDLANEGVDGWQDGPLFHLQYGGHNPDNRQLDHPLKAPRWCHPPMDVALLCELVAANFYAEKWNEFRDAPSWAGAIKLYEKLCYPHYVELLTKHIGVSGAPSALTGMWAGNWA